MNTDRLVREIEKRLADLPEAQRGDVLDAVKEEIARERRRLEPGLTVETERERRLEAETLREILEAINRQARLDETIEEVLKQLGRLVSLDSSSVALLEGGRFRIIAARGFAEPSKIIGATFQDPFRDEVGGGWPASVADIQEEPRFAGIARTDEVRSWAGIPLLVEGEVLGLLCVDRNRVEPFEEEDLHRARAVAFSAAAAIRKAQLHEQLRRYATLMERVVAVDHAVFAGRPAALVAGTILEGALEMGPYPGGLLIVCGAQGNRIVAAQGGLAGLVGHPVPPALVSSVATRLEAERARVVGTALREDFPLCPVYLVPLSTADVHTGNLVLLDPDGETPNDRLIEAYASRAATAYIHAARDGQQ